MTRSGPGRRANGRGWRRRRATTDPVTRGLAARRRTPRRATWGSPARAHECSPARERNGRSMGATTGRVGRFVPARERRGSRGNPSLSRRRRDASHGLGGARGRRVRVQHLPRARRRPSRHAVRPLGRRTRTQPSSRSSPPALLLCRLPRLARFDTPNPRRSALCSLHGCSCGHLYWCGRARSQALASVVVVVVVHRRPRSSISPSLARAVCRVQLVVSLSMDVPRREHVPRVQGRGDARERHPDLRSRGRRGCATAVRGGEAGEEHAQRWVLARRIVLAR